MIGCRFAFSGDWANIAAAISRRSLRLAAIGSVCVFLGACQLAPTKTSEREHRELSPLIEKTGRPIEITDKTVVLDARSAFDYGLNHIGNSIGFSWENLAENASTGEVMRDGHKAALRLSLVGIDLKTPVVVVGYGSNGGGEEGRLAWNLLYLGLQDVQVSDVDTFRKSWTQKPTPAPANVPIWKATPHTEYVIGKKAFLKLALDAKGQIKNRVQIVDVRSANEYAKESPQKIDISTLHIPWKEFYTATGRPDPDLKKKILALGIRQDDRIVLVSKHGVRSGAAAYALMALGFTHVENFTGGWRSLTTHD